jgi:hypothetical protein
LYEAPVFSKLGPQLEILEEQVVGHVAHQRTGEEPQTEMPGVKQTRHEDPENNQYDKGDDHRHSSTDTCVRASNRYSARAILPAANREGGA